MNPSVDGPHRLIAQKNEEAAQAPLGRLFTVRETAQILGLCQDTVRRYLRSGRLAGVRVGRTWRVPERAFVVQFGIVLRDGDTVSLEKEALDKETNEVTIASLPTPRITSELEVTRAQTMALVEKAAHHADLSKRARQRLLAELNDLLET